MIRIIPALALLAIWIASAAGLFLIPAFTGGWFAVGFVFGALTASFGFFLVDTEVDRGNRAWITIGQILAYPGVGIAIFCLICIVWRGIGLEVDWDINQR